MHSPDCMPQPSAAACVAHAAMPSSCRRAQLAIARAERSVRVWSDGDPLCLHYSPREVLCGGEENRDGPLNDGVRTRRLSGVTWIYCTVRVDLQSNSVGEEGVGPDEGANPLCGGIWF